MLKIVFLSLVLSSCGLIERFKTPEQPTDSKDATATNENSPIEEDSTDDLFSKTMDENSNQSSSDNPSNISSDDTELQSLQEEFAPMDPEKKEAPVLVEEALPEIRNEVEPATYSEAGQIKTYKVQRGETLMQIAFKLYGDTSKWKEIKNMNSEKLANNTSLQTNTELKYRAPASPFVWNPSGTPYIIKTGETLGTISNSVYSTPKKWKEIWENNKPLIQNPNVIYAGFTLYYTNGAMANFVQPEETQNHAEVRDIANNEGGVEEVIIDRIITSKKSNSQAPALKSKTITDAQTLTANDETQVDEAIQTLSATTREQVAKAVLKTTVAPNELDLVNNISVPHEQEMEPDIDEEVQTL